MGLVETLVRKAKIAATETASAPLERKIAEVPVWMLGRVLPVLEPASAVDA